MSGERLLKIFAWTTAYVVMSWFGLLLRVTPHDVPAFWPAAGVGVAAVYWALREGLPRRWAYSIVPIAYLLAMLPNQSFEILTISYGLASAAEAAVIAEVLRREWSYNQTGSRRSRVVSVASAVLIPAFTSFLALAAHVLISNITFPTKSFLTWWFGDSIGLMALGPAFLGLVAFDDVWRNRQWSLRKFVFPTLALAGSILVLFIPQFGYVFPGVLVSIWWALTFGFGPTSITTAIFASAVATDVAMGKSQFEGPYSLLFTQLFVSGYSFALVATAALADAHRRDLAGAVDMGNKLKRAVTHDPITGLRWRGDAIASIRALPDHEKIAVAILDIDGMGHINNVLGRTIGDQLLEVLAQRFLIGRRPEDVVARLGGDEFLLVARNLENEAEVQAIMDQVMDGLMMPMDNCSTGVSLSVCAGVTYGELSQFEDLMRDADQALHEVKQRGKGLVHIRTSQERALRAEQKKLTERFPYACRNGELACVFQPIVPITGALTFGAEALVRWNHPERGLVSPGVFIPALERSGLMVLLGETASALGLAQMHTWLGTHGDSPNWLSVNIHAAELLEGKLHERLLALLKHMNVPADALVLELTEHSTVNMDPSTRRQLDALRAEGVRIALDDFGTGYSSLAYLARLPIDILKLDAAFLSSHASEKDHRLTKAICALAKDIGLHTIVEGVETQDQLFAAVAAGADSVQGFWLGRPTSGAVLRGFHVPEHVVIHITEPRPIRVSAI